MTNPYEMPQQEKKEIESRNHEIAVNYAREIYSRTFGEDLAHDDIMGIEQHLKGRPDILMELLARRVEIEDGKRRVAVKEARLKDLGLKL